MISVFSRSIKKLSTVDCPGGCVYINGMPITPHSQAMRCIGERRKQPALKTFKVFSGPRPSNLPGATKPNKQINTNKIKNKQLKNQIWRF